MAPKDPGLTLVVSTPRSDSLKGFVTRLGTALVRAVRIISVDTISVLSFAHFAGED